MLLGKPPQLTLPYDIGIGVYSVSGDLELRLGIDCNDPAKQAWLEDVTAWASQYQGMKVEFRGVNHSSPDLSTYRYSNLQIFRGLTYFGKKHNLRIRINRYKNSVFNWLFNTILYLL